MSTKADDEFGSCLGPEIHLKDVPRIQDQDIYDGDYLLSDDQPQLMLKWLREQSGLEEELLQFWWGTDTVNGELVSEQFVLFARRLVYQALEDEYDIIVQFGKEVEQYLEKLRPGITSNFEQLGLEGYEVSVLWPPSTSDQRALERIVQKVMAGRVEDHLSPRDVLLLFAAVMNMRLDDLRSNFEWITDFELWTTSDIRKFPGATVENLEWWSEKIRKLIDEGWTEGLFNLCRHVGMNHDFARMWNATVK